jgi:hypothetical protein
MSYQDILWSRPTRRTGRILLTGGHRDGFADLQKAFVGFDTAGAAECHLALPDKLSKLVGSLEGITLVPSNPSGSIARDAVAQLVYLANESDLICIGPDLSNNSETTLAMQRVIAETRASIIIPASSTEQLMNEIEEWANRSNLMIFLNQKQLLKLTAKLAVDTTIPLNMTNEALIEITKAVSSDYKPVLILTTKDALIYAVDGQATILKVEIHQDDSGAITGLFGLFWLQNQSTPFEALQAAAHITEAASANQNLQSGIKEELSKL